MARSLRRMIDLAARFRADATGATAIEYSMIAAGIAAVVAGAVYSIGTTLETNFYGKAINGWK
jgi:pilus assembly protein Flp/PilA